MSTDTSRAGWAANSESLVLTGTADGLLETVVILLREKSVDVAV
jgi:hypothetical protein